MFLHALPDVEHFENCVEFEIDAAKAFFQLFPDSESFCIDVSFEIVQVGFGGETFQLLIELVLADQLLQLLVEMLLRSWVM